MAQSTRSCADFPSSARCAASLPKGKAGLSEPFSQRDRFGPSALGKEARSESPAEMRGQGEVDLLSLDLLDPPGERRGEIGEQLARRFILQFAGLVHATGDVADVDLGLLQRRHVEEDQRLAQMMIG